MSRESEKTIPFLRRLTDMLKENEEVISFHPGVRKKNGQTAIGRIVVHDRAKVESEILPRYFNHSSFASLRRQLNYFAFCRIGKGKQRGAIYCNDKVVELEDILRLKRRAVGSAIVPTTTDAFDANVQARKRKTSEFVKAHQNQPTKKSFAKQSTHKKLKGLKTSKPFVSSRIKKRSKKIANSVVPVVHLPKYDNANEMISSQCYHMPVMAHTISIPPSPTPQTVRDDVLSHVNCSSQKITSDMTKSLNHHFFEDNFSTSSAIFRNDTRMKNETLITTIHHDLTKAPSANRSVSISNKANTKEADILAGCSALLSLGCQ